MIAAEFHVKNRNVSGVIGRRAMIGWKKFNGIAVKEDAG